MKFNKKSTLVLRKPGVLNPGFKILKFNKINKNYKDAHILKFNKIMSKFDI